MGYIFETLEFTVFEPSLNVGRLLLASVRQFEQQVNMPCGLVEEMSDTIKIDPKMLLAFVQTLLSTSNLSNNESLFLLLHGPVVHLIALLRSVMPSVQLSNVPDGWTEEAIALLHHRFRVYEANQDNLA
jgi:hypothetical protein